MIYLQLFFSFLKIGALSFGGGSGMIAMMREIVLSYGWMTDEELLNFIAVAESTPGPIAVNLATFVGSSQGGFFGGLLATLGVILPSFVIILIIAALISNFMKYRVVGAVLDGIRPCVVALALATAVTLALSTLFSFQTVWSGGSPDVYGILILALLFVIHPLYQRVFHKAPSPILMILLSACLGLIFYS